MQRVASVEIGNGAHALSGLRGWLDGAEARRAGRCHASSGAAGGRRRIRLGEAARLAKVGRLAEVLLCLGKLRALVCHG